jgi:hypothetical protein
MKSDFESEFMSYLLVRTTLEMQLILILLPYTFGGAMGEEDASQM